MSVVVLHLFSNHKRTGPADLALALAAAQREEAGAGGGRVLFLSPDPDRTPDPPTAVQSRARELGIDEPAIRVRLPKHFRPLSILRDGARIREWLATDPVGRTVDVVHCHLRGDHLTAGRAARKVRRLDADRRLVVVRSFYDAVGGTRAGRRDEDAEPAPATGWRDRYALARLTDGLIAAAPSIAEAAREVFGVPGDRIETIEPGVDLARFDPGRALPDGREMLGLPPDAFVVGVVARVQGHRRFEVILRAVRALREAGTDARLLVLGRGTRLQEVGIDPARALGLDETVAVFPGFVPGDDYVRAVRAIDALVYLVPGSDGTCRAVREGMAAGLAIVGSRRGTLPEIIAEGETGVLVDDRDDDPDAPRALADALAALAADPERRAALGAAALAHARDRLGVAAQARATLAFYERIKAHGPRPR